MGWRLRVKRVVYYGGSLKILIFRVGSHKKTIYRGDFLKKEGLDRLQI